MSRAKITFRYHKETAAMQPVEDRHEEESVFRQEDLREGAKVFDSSALHPMANDFGAWSNPFEIRDKDADPVTGYFRYDASYDSFSGPEWDEKLTSRVFRRTTPAPWSKIAASVLGAVMTGVLFGVFLLTMFSETDNSSGLQPLDWPAQGAEQDAPLSRDQGAATPDGSRNNSGDAQMTAVKVLIPAREYAVLQNGVFANSEGARTAENDLRNKGFAPVVEKDGQHYVFVGVAPQRDDALFLSSLLQDQNVEVFVKTLTLPMVERVHWNGGAPRLLQTFLEDGERLARLIVERSISFMREPEARRDVNEIVSGHQQWSRNLSNVSKGIPANAVSELDQMNQGMMLAVEAMNAYAKNASPAYLWQAQAGVLQYLLAERHLLEKIRSD